MLTVKWTRPAACLLALAALALAALACAAPADDLTIETDVIYGTAGGQKLLLDVYLPRAPAPGGKRPAVLFVHGGGWAAGSKRDFRDAAMGTARLGYACFSINYRLVTATGNRYPAQLDDAQRAVRWIRANAGKYGVDPKRVGALGASAGGHLVALLGTTETRDNSDKALAAYSSRVTCVVDLFGPADLTADFPTRGQALLDVQALVDNLVGTTRAKGLTAFRDASPLFHIDKKTAPFLIFQGTTDPLVPADQSRRLHAALRKAGIPSTLVEFPGEGHGFAKKENADRCVHETAAFLAKWLKP